MPDPRAPTPPRAAAACGWPGEHSARNQTRFRAHAGRVLPVLTPLAMTPARDSMPTSTTTSATPALNVTPVVAGHESGAASKSAQTDTSTPVHLPAQLAAALPPALAIPKAADAVPAVVKTVTGSIETANAVMVGVEAVSSNALEQSLPAQVAYNFIRFDAATFHDAVSLFANELASLTQPSATHHSNTRAWIITGTVLGLDAVFLSYLHQRARRQKRLRPATVKVLARQRRRS